MEMTLTQQLITIAMCVLGTMATRYIPFLLFPPGRQTPPYVQYLGKVLPSAVFALLVVYCLKDVSLTTGSHGIPEALALAVTPCLAAADVPVHGGRHHPLYGAGPDRVRRVKEGPLFLQEFY